MDNERLLKKVMNVKVDGRSTGGCMRRGSEWWNEGVKTKVEEKKRAFEEWLQCNSAEKYERYTVERKMWKPSERWRKRK